MDSFDLHWPKASATLYTNGALLKIVVRDKRGPSGTINNCELCKERVAFGLAFAPGLLAALKAKGYKDLAAEIEQRASGVNQEASDPISDWLDSLPGDAAWENCGTKRASKWHQVSDDWFLKLPVKRGQQEWVLKQTPANDKPTYLAAADLKGIFAAIRDAKPEMISAVVAACADIADQHDELGKAIAAWPKH